MLGPFFVFRATFGRYWGAMQLFEQLIIHKEPLFICFGHYKIWNMIRSLSVIISSTRYNFYCSKFLLFIFLTAIK